MSDSLYGMPVLRLAAAVADYPPLETYDVRAERRSPVCGSWVAVTLRRDDAGQVSAVGLDARACALGQAAATVLARAILGRTSEEVAAASAGWAAYLSGESDALPDWPDLATLAGGRDYPARHASLRLAFEAATEGLATHDDGRLRA